MIELTRLNGRPIVLNSDLIKTVEASPDTTLTLINGEKIIVRESCDDLVARVTVYRAHLLAMVGKKLTSLTDLSNIVALVSLDPESHLGAKAGQPVGK